MFNHPKATYQSLKNIAKDDRPREKMLENGSASLSNAEIIGILIGSGTREKSAVQLSREILSTVDNDLSELARLSIHDLMKFRGIGLAKAVSIAAALEIGRRKENGKEKKSRIVSSPREIYYHIKEKLVDLNHEEFYIMLLDNRNNIISIELISKGGINGTVVDKVLIFKRALEKSATKMALCHNHPSGNNNPSEADISITKDIVHVATSLGIQIVDHIIVAGGKYFSFSEQGLIINQ